MLALTPFDPLALLDVPTLALALALVLPDPDVPPDRDAPADADADTDKLNETDTPSDVDEDRPPAPAALRENGSDSESEDDVVVVVVVGPAVALVERESAPLVLEGSGAADDAARDVTEAGSEVCRGCDCDSEDAVALGPSDVVLGASVVRSCTWDVVVVAVAVGAPESALVVPAEGEGEVFATLESEVASSALVLVGPAWVAEAGEVESASDVPVCAPPDKLPSPPACLAMTKGMPGSWGVSSTPRGMISRVD